MRIVNFRSDGRTDALLRELTADGTSVSDAIRQAIADSIRLRDRDRMRRESLEYAGDPEDLSESRAVRAEMDVLRAR